MRILALDMATKTGWAVNKPELSGVENFAIKRGESPGMRFLRFHAWLEEMFQKVKPNLVVYEQAHHRGGAATAIALGMIAILQKQCAERGVEYMTCHTGTLKKHATGKGNASKSEMMRAYKAKWGHEPMDDNECDARWLLDWAITNLCPCVYEQKEAL